VQPDKIHADTQGQSLPAPRPPTGPGLRRRPHPRAGRAGRTAATHPPRARDCHPGRWWSVQPPDRPAAGRLGPHRGGPPLPRLHQTRRLRPHRTRRPAPQRLTPAAYPAPPDASSRLLASPRRIATTLDHVSEHRPPAEHHGAAIPMTTTTINHVPADATASVADLLRRIGDGDQVAWDEILRRYGKLVSTTVRSFRLQEADALDAVQMTWLRLADNTHRVQFTERLGGWLATTARRECLHILRQTKRGPHLTAVSRQKMSPTPQQIPSSAPSTLTPHGRCASSSTSCHHVGEP
jgi:sigma-70-like protein